jgi:phosphoserine phosphatase
MSRKDNPKKKESLYYFDLDGTLMGPEVNNTFTFLKEFYRFNNRQREYRVKRIISFFLEKIPFIKAAKRKRIIMMLFLKKLNINELIRFTSEEYMTKTVKTNINKALMAKIGKQKINGNIITACIEVPAKQIANLFDMELVCSTRFVLDRSNSIIGLIIVDETRKQDSIPKLEELKHAIYFTDTPNLEKELIRYFHKAYWVNDEKITRIK